MAPTPPLIRKKGIWFLILLLLQLLERENVRASESSSVSNPYYRGCLHEKIGTQEFKLRVCNSHDPPSALQDGLCRDPDFDYMEIRINAGDWDSPIIATWLVQIILSEILGVPTTVEAGSYGESRDFYDPQSRIDYWTTSHVKFIGHASQYKNGGCRYAPKTEDNYQPCAHFAPEHWHAEGVDVKQELANKTIDPPNNIGSLGHETWFVTKFSIEQDPSLVSYIGLQGEERRHRLAEVFHHPTTWRDYCETVSPSNCTVPDGVAERPPVEDEGDRYFANGLFTGYFQLLEENNCTLHPATCGGHIGDYPCDWPSYMESLLYHLDIPLDHHRYNYGRATELWDAANATKSNLMLYWWTPEPLYQRYLGTDAEMIPVVLPPQTQECIEARPSDECAEDMLDRVGPPEAACAQAARPLAKMISSMLRDADVPEAIQSPAYAMLQSYQLREVQLNELFGLWINEDNPREAVCKWAVENMDFLNQHVPSTYPRVPIVEDVSAMSYIAMGLAAFAALVIISTSIAVYKCQDRGAIRYAQVEFLWLLLAGSFLITIGAILSSVPAKDSTCIAAIWFINIGYTLELVPLIVKVAAINTMMASARRMRRVTLERKHLHGAVGVISLLIIIFLILWTVLDPPHKDTDYSLTESSTDTGDQVVALSHFCEDGDSDGWKFAAVAWNAGLLLCASVLAFQTRNIIKTFNESQTLAILIYSHLIFVVLRLATYFLDGDVSGSTLNYIRSILYSIDTLATIVIYFVPKFFAQDDDLVGQSTALRVSGLTPPVRSSRNVTMDKTSAGSVGGSAVFGDQHKSDIYESKETSTAQETQAPREEAAIPETQAPKEESAIEKTEERKASSNTDAPAPGE